MFPTFFRLAFPLLLAMLPAAASAPRLLRLGQDAAAWRLSADTLRRDGYRPLSLDAEGPGDHPALATVWAQAGGAAWDLAPPAPAREFQSRLRDWNAKGYRPYALTAMPAPGGDEGEPWFAALLIADGAAADARLDLDAAGFRAACDSARRARAKCDWLDAYGGPGHPRFAALFVRDSAGTPWNYSLADDAASLKTKQEIFSEVWVRPARISPMPGGRFATIWEENSAGAWSFDPDGNASTLAGAAQRDSGSLLLEARPRPGDPGRYALLMSSATAPVPRAWTVEGPAAPGLQAFDDYMRELMRKRGVRAGALAIAREGRLVFAHGYTWAEPGYPLTRPNSLFRVASCSKPLTSILVHKVVREGEGAGKGPSLKQKILSLLHPGDGTAETPADPRFGEITVDELLTHSGGWIRSRAHPDPVFNDYPPGSDIRKRLPADRKGFLAYMLGQPLQFDPGSRSVYDNFGFFLLGRMLESLPMALGRTYQSIAEDLLFKPLGLARPRFGGSRYEERAPGEVLYHTAVPYLQANPKPGGPPWVAGGYGDFELDNMDAAGAWVLSAPDYAKVLAAFDLGARNPILGPRGTAAMWGPSPYGDVLRGWFGLKMRARGGKAEIAKWHNGLFPGISTLVFYHPEKWSFVMFLNRDLSPQPDGPHEGRDLSRLAESVKAWPQRDLFPAMGIPPFSAPAIGPEQAGPGQAGPNRMGPEQPGPERGPAAADSSQTTILLGKKGPEKPS